MKPFNLMAVVFLVLLGVFVIVLLERLKLQDSRIRRIEDRIEALERDSDRPAIDMRPEINRAF